MDSQRTKDLQTSYNRVAKEYVERIFNELKNKPLDCALLDWLAEKVQGLGPVCDLGCGPGQIARYLQSRGVEVLGIDLSPSMIEQARQLNPGIEFKQGDMLSLEIADESWGGIAAFYSIIHIPREEVPHALREMKRVLRPGAWLLLSFHVGQEIIHRNEWWGEEVSLDFIFFGTEEMQGYLAAAGFDIAATIARPPYETIEYPSRRAYIFARKPKHPKD